MSAVKSNWDKADIVRRLCCALDIARHAIEHLAATGFQHPENADNNIRPEKVIGETAYLMLAASAAEAYIEISNRLKELAIILLPHARNKKTLLNICLYPAFALEYAQAHICLTKLGYPDPAFDALLTQTINAHAHVGHERPPHRIMEQAWIKYIWNGDKSKITTIATYSSLAHPIDLLHGTTDDMYAFTHALMYLSHFSYAHGKLPRGKREIMCEAEAMLAKCMDAQDYDLAGEVLLTWPLTVTPWSATAAFAFKVLTKMEDKVGFLPSLGMQYNTLQQLENEQRKKYLYSTTYHTIYVMGLLCAAILMYGKTPPKQIPLKHVKRGSARMLLPFLKQTPQPPYWMEVLNTLDEQEQDAMATFIFHVAIIRNVHQKDYKNVYQLLKTGYELELTNTPLALQAAELLERMNMLAVYQI